MFEKVERLSVDMDLTGTAYQEAVVEYMQANDMTTPSVLFVCPASLHDAYEIVRDATVKMLVVPIPDMQNYEWAVGGARGFIYSPGV